MMKLKFRAILIILFSGLVATGCSSTLDVGDEEPISRVISYSVPNEAHVKLCVENSYKTAVAILVDEVKQAGIHQAIFVAVDSDGNNLPEAVYTYLIKTDEYSLSRTLHLFYR